MVGIRYHVLDGRQWVGRWRDINFAMKFSMRFNIPCVSFPYSYYYFFFSFPLYVSFWFPLSFTFFFSLCSLFFTFSFYHFTSPHSTICPPDSSRTYPASTPYRPSHSVSFCAAVASASYPISSITIVASGTPACSWVGEERGADEMVRARNNNAYIMKGQENIYKRFMAITSTLLT